MGRLSKATITWQNNLTKCRNPTVEDISDEDMDFQDEDSDNLLGEGFFILDEGDPLEEDSDDGEGEEIGKDELDKLRNEAAMDLSIYI